MIKKIEIGILVEIKTSIGYSYAQCTHMHPQYGALVRILPGAFGKPCSSFDDLVMCDTVFYCFLPLLKILNEGIFKVVGCHVVPDKEKKFPVFRVAMMNPITKKNNGWYLWDGEKEWRIDELSEEQKKMSIRGVWNDTLLIERIESGWRPEEYLSSKE